MGWLKTVPKSVMNAPDDKPFQLLRNIENTTKICFAESLSQDGLSQNGYGPVLYMYLHMFSINVYLGANKTETAKMIQTVPKSVINAPRRQTLSVASNQ